MYKLLLILGVLSGKVTPKYVQGELNTHENWAFLARFCFLSEAGEFEYLLEFDDEQGNLNLLMYYDTDDQWPSVYKQNKTCLEKEKVLNVNQNQIIYLSARNSFSSGCTYSSNYVYSTSKPAYTMYLPTIKPRVKNATTPIPKTTTTTKQTTLKTTTSTTTTTYKPTVEQKMTTILNNETTDSDFEYLTTENNVETVSSAEINSRFQTGFETTTEDLKLQYEFIDGGTGSTQFSYKKAPIKKRSLPNKTNFPKNVKTNRKLICRNRRGFRSARERWWFVAISNCNSSKGIHLKYKILMTNGPPGDYWHEHFSADEFYILPILMSFVIAYSFLMLGIVMCSVELKSRQLLHTTYKIFVVSAIWQLIGILFNSVTYLRYASTGLLSTKARRIGNVFMGASETAFVILLLLLAKGYTITRGRLPVKGSVKLTIFMCLYVLVYVSIFFYESQNFDPGEVLYLYESPPGHALMILRIAAWCMFIYSTIFTLKHYPEKANFYYPFNICGTLWFIAGPAFILSANTYIDKWVRESIVCLVLLFTAFGGHLSFLILTMPSMANKNFPYHVRTTQIGVMEIRCPENCNPDLEQFNHHIYEPTTASSEQTLIVPLTRRTEEIFEGMYNQRMFNSGRRSIDIRRDTNDTSLDNVLTWSLAKNISALPMLEFQKNTRQNSAITRDIETSHNSPTLSQKSHESIQNPSQNEIKNDTPLRGHFDDYVRDVPIELFTVSRMVLTPRNTEANNMKKDNVT